MPWKSFELIFLCVLVCFFNLTNTKTQDADAVFLFQSCGAEITIANSPYQMNLRTLLSSLSSKATDNTFSKDTVVGRNSSDTVYGLFMCRGDVHVPSQLCRLCVVNATNRISSDSECSLSNTMNQTAEEAAVSANRYSTKNASLSEFETLYCLAQCTQDLLPQNCTTCLTQAIWDLLQLSKRKQGGRVAFPSCNIRYELYPFYLVADHAPEAVVPETKYPHTDSEDPVYISHNCSTNQNMNDTAFQLDLTNLFSNLSSNANSGIQDNNGKSARPVHVSWRLFSIPLWRMRPKRNAENSLGVSFGDGGCNLVEPLLASLFQSLIRHGNKSQFCEFESQPHRSGVILCS